MNSNTEKQAQTELNDGSLRRQTDSSLAPAAEGGGGAGREDEISNAASAGVQRPGSEPMRDVHSALKHTHAPPRDR